MTAVRVRSFYVVSGCCQTARTHHARHRCWARAPTANATSRLDVSVSGEGSGDALWRRAAPSLARRSSLGAHKTFLGRYSSDKAGK